MTKTVGLSLLDRLKGGDARQRRVAAIQLGKTGQEDDVRFLLEAIARETDDVTSASMILALGAIGGTAAVRAIDAIHPLGEQSKIALRKARGRLVQSSISARWRDGLVLPDVYLEVPPGLERPATLHLHRSGWPRVELARPGLLRFQTPIAVERVSPPPRWSYRPRILLGIEKGSDEQAVGSLFRRVAADLHLSQWLENPDTAFRYRLAVEGRLIDKALFGEYVRRSRAAFETQNAIDSPSDYFAKLVVSFEADSVLLYLKPHFYVDDRFSYRKRDVAASMNPVVAAAIAQLAPTGLSGAVIDPVCGSAVPLIERGLFDAQASCLIGLDIEPSARDAAKANVAAAGMTDRASIRNADARDPNAWQECGMVIANLPYGLRLKSSPKELSDLYLAIAQNAARHLTADGRVILASAYREGIERTLAATTLRTLARYRVETGGLFVQVAVLGKL